MPLDDLLLAREALDAAVGENVANAWQGVGMMAVRIELLVAIQRALRRMKCQPS